MKTNTQQYSRPLRLALGLSIAAIAGAGAIQAADTNNGMTNNVSSMNLAHSDRSFLEKAYRDGMEEVNISNIAVEKSTNPQVKEYAQMLVSDHTSVDSQLTNLASEKGVQLPTKERSTSRWEKKDSKNFDDDYLKKMISDHEDAIELYSKGARSDNPEIAAFASKQIATLQTHLAKAKDLRNSLPRQ